MMPRAKIINSSHASAMPDDMSDFAMFTRKSKGNVIIEGSHGLLNLSGARIYESKLLARTGSSVYTLLLCGAYIPNGVDLTHLHVKGRLNAQGLNTGQMTLEHVAEDIDFTGAKVRELLLNLQYLVNNPRAPSLKLTDSYIEYITLPENHLYMPTVDARGATILGISSWVNVGELLIDERTHLDKTTMNRFNYAKLTTEAPPHIYVQ